MPQVFCAVAKTLFKAADYRNTGTITDDYRQFKLFNLESIVDTNGDNAVDFEEWFAKLKEYLAIVFKELDVNHDGSLLDETKKDDVLKKFSLGFFQYAANQVVDFLDSNKDDAVSLDDAFFNVFCRYRYGDCSLSDVLGTPLISLPAPFYNLYYGLDTDENEKFSRGEVMDFIQRTFAAFDGSLDCHIDEDEIVELLKEVGLPGKFQLAIKMLLHQYLTLGRYLVQELIQRADTNQDGQVTFEEVLGFTDWDFIEEQIPVVMILALLQLSIISFSVVAGGNTIMSKTRNA